MFLKWFREDKEKNMKAIEDDLHYLYGYSRKEISRMSDAQKEDIWIEENEEEENEL